MYGSKEERREKDVVTCNGSQKCGLYKRFEVPFAATIREKLQDTGIYEHELRGTTIQVVIDSHDGKQMMREFEPGAGSYTMKEMRRGRMTLLALHPRIVLQAAMCLCVTSRDVAETYTGKRLCRPVRAQFARMSCTSGSCIVCIASWLDGDEDDKDERG